MKLWRVAALSLAAVSAMVTLAGCSSGSERSIRYTWNQRPLDAEMIFKRPQAPRDLRMFSGGEHNRLTWQDVMDSVLWAHVVVIGHRADDSIALQTETALVADSLAKWPWTVVSLEVMDEGQQSILDAYLAGQLSVEDFSKSVDPDGRWVDGYLPIIDAAKATKSRVVAASSHVRPVRPEELTEEWQKMSRKEQKAAMEAADAADPRVYSLVIREDGSPDLITSGGGAGLSTDPSQQAMDQMLIDSSNLNLAKSIVKNLKGVNARVIHIGSHHRSDFQAGVVQKIEELKRGSQILTITFTPRNEPNLQVEDFDRADVVIHSGI